MIVLVGFMGAGKSTVAELLAERLNLPFVDTDRLIEERAGRSIAQIFERDGEDAFRKTEFEIVNEVLSGDEAVVALGGGSVENEAARSLLADAVVVYLSAPLEESLRRIADPSSRPLLRGEHDLIGLFERRARLYEQVADLTAATQGRSPDSIADELLSGLGGPQRDRFVGTIVKVDLGPRSYDVLVGSRILHRVIAAVPDDAEHVFVVTHPELEPLAAPVVDDLKRERRDVHVLLVPEGERSKSWAEAGRLLSTLADVPAHRKDVVVAFGGGVIGDLAAFVASTYARGLRVIQVATSLLAQVDAAIGGKTAVNLAQGKNLVGTFHQPLAVFCDVKLLRSLSDRELRCGLAEVIKYGFIADPSLLETIRDRSDAIFARDERVLRPMVKRSASIKAHIVSTDETEQGHRAWLNYGHTIGHAVERSDRLEGIRHGEAVALGMMAAAHLAHDAGRIDDELLSLHRTTLEAVGLPVRADLDVDMLEEVWLRDKKYDGGMRFVLLNGLGKPEAGIGVDRSSIEKALKRMAE
ncbi:MAG: shikimate kinase / 3-dehydroquinate synthase [Actinomycetota bacterium]|jgi:3-dehydroquinate synthase|nr:shikimate kinase / 3-dehydroquinate synthase [Actinomycetota bacterium]